MNQPIPRNFSRHKTLMTMDYVAVEKRQLTKEERDAKKEQARLVAKQNLRERSKKDEAFKSNFKRLKAERKAREGSDAYPPPEQQLGGGDICSLEREPSTEDDQPLD